MAKQQTPKQTNTSGIDTNIPIKGMTKDLNTSLVGKENWTHAINAINNSKDGDVGTLGNEPGNKLCSSAPYTIIGTIHLYGDKWVLYSTNNTISEIGLWDDSECKYETIVNDFTCYDCLALDSTPCLNFDTQHLITGAAKENFDCSWQVYWDDGKNPSRTLNIDNVPYIQEVVSEEGEDCVIKEDTICLDCEKLRLAPLVDIPCIKLSKSTDGGQLRNGSYQAFIAYTINDQVVGDFYGISNIQPLFDHEDLKSGLEIEITNLDKGFEYFKLVILSHNQGEIQAKEMGIYSTEQSTISIDYINQALKTVPLNTLPLTTPAFEKSEKMYVVNDYLIRQGPTERYDFNYQPIANQIHTHWTVTQFDSDYYKKGGNKPTFMRDEVYAFFIRFVYETGEKSRSYHIPGRPPTNWTAPNGSTIYELDELAGDINNLGAQASLNGLCDNTVIDRAFEVYNTALNQPNQFWNNPGSLTEGNVTDDCGTVIAEGHMAYWESTERYPNDPVRYNSVDGDERYDLCNQPIRHHKFPDETFSGSGPGGILDRSSNNGHSINVLGVKFENIKVPRYSASFGQVCAPDDGTPTGPVIPGIVGYEILVGSREGNKSIIAKGISRNMRQYTIPQNAQGQQDNTATVGYIANYPFNSAQGDPYLAGDPGFSFNYQNPQNTNSYPAANTAANIFTFHGPDTSFNRPFLSPFEIKTYGLTTGSSIGRFRPSENHPQHKLLRNLAMWVGIIVGIGYAIGQMRGKRTQRTGRPQGYSMGFQQNARDGGSSFGNTSGSSGTIPGGITASGNINTSQSGARAGAPASAGQGLALLNPDTQLNANEAGQNTPFLGPNLGLNSALTGATIIGAPKVAKDVVYDNAKIAQDSSKTTALRRGYIGRLNEESYEGERFTEAPGLVQVLFGIFNFMQLTAEGGQVIIDAIYELVSLQDYAWKYSGHGFYINTNAPASGQVSRMLVDKGRYIGSTIQNLTANIRINNLQRPSTVAISAIAPPGAAGFVTPTPAQDNSRFIIGGIINADQTIGGWWNPSQWQIRPIAAHYTSLKVAFRNQYGQLDQIKQIPSGCIHYFTQENVEKDSRGEYKYDLEDTSLAEAEFQTQIIYGGDSYINRYTEKVIMPFFWDFLDGQPDMFAYDYRLRSNVPRPIYWMNTAKYDLSELVRYITTLGFLDQGNAGLNAISPNSLHFLDRPGNDLANDGVAGAGDNAGDGSGIGGGSTAAGPNAIGNPNNANDGITQDRGGRSIFHIKNGYMYTHCNGIQDFFVESTLNIGLRDYEDTDEKRHYDFSEYTDVEAMFHSKIIRKDNFYKYDFSLSKSRFNTQLISFGQIQDRDYDPITAEKCFTHFPKRLIYSLQAQKEAKKDFWRVFLPFNYKDFKNRVNVIKPISKSGALVTFPNLAPALFQGVDQLQTDLGTKLTIGDGGLFSQPMQNVVNADEAHEYGSCESARSVINTPSGLYYISQAQGKIFTYSGRGLENIANAGMKQWFNKYLPSVLLSQFPEMEDCPGWIDNPVAGVGCQSVYDPNYDLVYFCKKDYQALDPDCIEFDPCNGFVFNITKCSNADPIACCPDGYETNVNPVTGEVLCKGEYELEPILTSTTTYEYGAAIGVGTSAGLASYGNSRYGRDWPIVIDDVAIDGMPSNQADPNTWHYITDNGSNTWWRNTPANNTNGIVNALMRGSGNEPNNFAVAEFQVNVPVPKTVHILLAADNGFLFEENIGGVWSTVVQPNDNTLFGVGLAGIWSGQTGAGGNFAWLAGDAANASQYSKAWIYRYELQQGCTRFRMTGLNQQGTPGALAAAVIDVDNWLDIQSATSWASLPKLWSSDVNDFLRENGTTGFRCDEGYTEYTDGTDGGTEDCPVCRRDTTTYDCECPPDSNGFVPTVTGLCPDANDTIGTSTCIYTEVIPGEFIDNTIPISIDDEQYFKDVSWTVSYDPKAKAWISFHDWHPDLTIPSLNHFFTTKNIELDEIPSCPPGFTYDPVTNECCQQGTTEVPGNVIVDEELPVPVSDQAECLVDIVISVDRSGSTSSFFNSFQQFVDEFVAEFAPEMNSGNAQIGLNQWGTSYSNVTPDMSGNYNTNSISMSHYTGSTNWGTDAMTSSTQGTDFYEAFDNGQQQLSDVTNSTLGDRTANPLYRRIHIQLADGAAGDNPNAAGAAYYSQFQGSSFPTDLPNVVFGLPNIDAFNQGIAEINSESWGIFCHPTNTAPAAQFDIITNNNTNFQRLDLTPLEITPFSAELADNICATITCTCPEGYERISIDSPYEILTDPLDCNEQLGDRKNGICRKIECDCDIENSLPDSYVPGSLQQLGTCPDDIPNGIAEYYNEDTGIGNPAFVNPDPTMCQFDYLCCIPSINERGGIWKHNDRCDLYTNYYTEDYPWEVELIESVGQTVNTVRSIEYQLESYIYRGNLDNDCGDRFHDLDYNFDEAILHNTEQVSGLLALNLSPKNNAPLITQYPQITPNDIQILYSKEEQKYRFNQFWDVTNNRGEFDPNVSEPIFITQLNGYIRDLNLANIDLNKPFFQRKKFRHYWNAVVLRKRVSGNRKMILKLNNSKINVSFR